MDKIEIIITRGCDGEGNGGTVVENAGALLGDVIGGGTMLHAIVSAFEDAYGLHEIEQDGTPIPVNGFRNLTYRIRTHITEITASWLKQRAINQFAQQVDGAVSRTLDSVTIIDNG